ncbi:MAG: transporter substrate-binding domain-containing protein [Dorea sp.]
MKKRLALILALAMMATTVLAGCGSKEDTSDADEGAKTEDAQEVDGDNDDTTFVVGFDAAFPPYGYKDDNGEYVGFDLDLAQEVCDRNGWELVKQPIDWDSKDMEIESGTIDCIWNGFTMNGREDDYTWSEAYIDNKQVVVVRTDSGIESFDDLAGKLVEVQTDSSALAALQDDQKALADTFGNLTEIAEYNTAFMDLESGACDAIAMDIGVAYYQINSRENSGDYKILDEEISSEQYGIGFKKGNTELRDKVQATLDEMAADGTIEEIAEKYADFGVPGSLCIGKDE